MIKKTAEQKGVLVVAADFPDLPDVRMQNIALLSHALGKNALPHLDGSHLRRSLEDLLSGNVLAENLGLLERYSEGN